jgi:NhaA family Na+:H+ antiporter
MRQEAAGGIVLAAATVAALLWANLDPGSYASLWDTAVTLEVGGRVVEEDLLHVVNDGLMTLFFLVIGLEVKRELTVGELRDPKAASLPFFAALGGMVVPALIFLALTAGGEGGDGWGIPIATDVAFALAALAALGSRVPTALVAFLLGIAVIDDIGAIAVIAIFYTDALHLAWLAAAGAGLVAVAALNRIHVRSTTVYVVLGIAIWFATFESGVHATLAGVALGLLTPARPFQPPAAVGAEAAEVSRGVLERPDDDETDAGRMRRLSWLSKEAISPLDRVEHALHRWSSFVVLPIFALANAGIALDRDGLDAVTANGVAAGVAAGLVVGKLIGVTGGTLLAVRLGVLHRVAVHRGALLPGGPGARDGRPARHPRRLRRRRDPRRRAPAGGDAPAGPAGGRPYRSVKASLATRPASSTPSRTLSAAVPPRSSPASPDPSRASSVAPSSMPSIAAPPGPSLGPWPPAPGRPWTGSTVSGAPGPALSPSGMRRTNSSLLMSSRPFSSAVMARLLPWPGRGKPRPARAVCRPAERASGGRPRRGGGE